MASRINPNVGEEEKKCSHCGEWKPLDCFAKDSTHSDLQGNRHCRCKLCYNKLKTARNAVFNSVAIILINIAAYFFPLCRIIAADTGTNNISSNITNTAIELTSDDIDKKKSQILSNYSNNAIASKILISLEDLRIKNEHPNNEFVENVICAKFYPERVNGFQRYSYSATNAEHNTLITLSFPEIRSYSDFEKLKVGDFKIIIKLDLPLDRMFAAYLEQNNQIDSSVPTRSIIEIKAGVEEKYIQYSDKILEWTKLAKENNADKFVKLINIQSKPLTYAPSFYEDLVSVVRTVPNKKAFAFEWDGTNSLFLIVDSINEGSVEKYYTQDLEFKKDVYNRTFDTNNDFHGKYPHLYVACKDSLKSYYQFISNNKSKIETIFK